jgi:hypothetical protein
MDDRKGLKIEKTPASVTATPTGAAVIASLTSAVVIALGAAVPDAKADWELSDIGFPYECPGTEDPITCATSVEATTSLEGAHSACVGQINTNGIQAYYDCWDASVQSSRNYFLNLAYNAYGWMGQSGNVCGDAHSTPWFEQPTLGCAQAGFDFGAAETLYNGLAYYTTGYGYYYLYGSS